MVAKDSPIKSVVVLNKLGRQVKFEDLSIGD